MTKQTYSIVGQKFKGLDPYLPGIAPGTPVLLVREPENQYDHNAVAVWIGGKAVGYVPKANNAALAQFIDQEGKDEDVIVEQKIAADSASMTTRKVRAITGVFVRSPNSAYPQVEL